MICKKKSDELRNSWCAFIDSHRLQLGMLRVISGTQLPDFVSVQSPKDSDPKLQKKQEGYSQQRWNRRLNFFRSWLAAMV